MWKSILKQLAHVAWIAAVASTTAVWLMQDKLCT